MYGNYYCFTGGVVVKPFTPLFKMPVTQPLIAVPDVWLDDPEEAFENTRVVKDSILDALEDYSDDLDYLYEEAELLDLDKEEGEDYSDDFDFFYEGEGDDSDFLLITE